MRSLSPFTCRRWPGHGRALQPPTPKIAVQLTSAEGSFKPNPLPRPARDFDAHPVTNPVRAD